MRNALLSQKQEFEHLRGRTYVPREGLKKARTAMSGPLIKVIVGPRRAGKSVFALQMLADRECAYVNFDDDRLAGLRDFDRLLTGIAEVYGNTRTLFFDEIQNVEGWELLANRLHRQGYNLLLTGSNAHLLSRELATHLTGRFREFSLFPFSFAEFLRAKKVPIDAGTALPVGQGTLLNHLDAYLRDGGFPETVLGGVETGNYLATLFESILLKDVVKRFNVRFAGRLLELGRYLATNHAREYTFNSVAKAVGFRSVHTAENYLGYLQEAFLFFSVNRFSWKARERIQAPRKIYACDPGFVGAVGFRTGSDKGRLLETVVAIELRRRGAETWSFKTPQGRETDFIIRKSGQSEALIQVCLDLSDPGTRKRELSGLGRASADLGCDRLAILTWEEEGTAAVDGKPVSLLPCWKWLLGLETL